MPDAGDDRVHTVFSAECNAIFDWHSIGLFHSHRTSGQPGGITRLLACSEEQLKTYQGLDIGRTFVHPDWRNARRMNYAAFNKPASVKYWVNSGDVPKGVEYIMQLDADMLINRPVHPSRLGVRPGVVLSAPYSYLVGTQQGLADHLGRTLSHRSACADDTHRSRIAPRIAGCRDPELGRRRTRPQCCAQ